MAKKAKDLKDQREAYKSMYGDNPAEVLADQIYWTQENRKYTDNEVVWESKPLRVEYILA
jgi:hypothetical protein